MLTSGSLGDSACKVVLGNRATPATVTPAATGAKPYKSQFGV